MVSNIIVELGDATELGSNLSDLRLEKIFTSVREGKCPFPKKDRVKGSEFALYENAFLQVAEMNKDLG